MADQDHGAYIRAYLEQHSEQYDHDELRRQLLDDGLPEDEIDLAMTEVLVSDSDVPTAAAPTNSIVFVLTLLGTMALNLYIGGTVVLYYFDVDLKYPQWWPLQALLALFGVEGAIAYVLRQRRRARGRTSLNDIGQASTSIESGPADVSQGSRPSLSRGLLWGLGVSAVLVLLFAALIVLVLVLVIVVLVIGYENARN